MAISAKSKILASDVSGKVDTAGTGLTKSGTTLSLATVVTAGNAGPTANATPAFGATFTVPYITYDAYGRITGRTNRTVKIPAAPTSVSSATTVTSVPNVAGYKRNNGQVNTHTLYGKSFTGISYTLSQGDYSLSAIKLPSGGTWLWLSNGIVLGSGAGGASFAAARRHNSNFCHPHSLTS